jgi:hypothetical protein
MANCSSGRVRLQHAHVGNSPAAWLELLRRCALRFHVVALNLPRRSAKRLAEMLEAGADEGHIGPLPYEAAKDLTAAMFGFPDWNALRDSLRTGVPSESDEVISNEAELATRRLWQASELQRLYPRMSFAFAEQLVDEWRPTCAIAIFHPPQLTHAARTESSPHLYQSRH